MRTEGSFDFIYHLLHRRNSSKANVRISSGLVPLRNPLSCLEHFELCLLHELHQCVLAILSNPNWRGSDECRAQSPFWYFDWGHSAQNRIPQLLSSDPLVTHYMPIDRAAPSTLHLVHEFCDFESDHFIFRNFEFIQTHAAVFAIAISLTGNCTHLNTKLSSAQRSNTAPHTHIVCNCSLIACFIAHCWPLLMWCISA